MFSLVLFIGLSAGVSLPIALELVRATFSSAMRLRGLGLPVIWGGHLRAAYPAHQGASLPSRRRSRRSPRPCWWFYGALIIFSSGRRPFYEQ